MGLLRESLIAEVPVARAALIRTEITYEWSARTIVVRIHCDTEEVKSQLCDPYFFDPVYNALIDYFDAPVEVDFWVDRAEIPRNSDAFYNSSRWYRVRYAALEKCGGKCLACGRSVRDGIRLHVDHIKSRSHYPELSYNLSNLQVLCNECNVGKSNIFETDWRPKIMVIEEKKVDV